MKLEEEWTIELRPAPPDKKPFLCRMKLHAWKKFTHMQARQTLYKCMRCGQETGRRRI